MAITACAAPSPVVDFKDGVAQVTVITCGLDTPWGLSVLPDGDVLVSERSGGVRLVHAGRLAEPPVRGAPHPTVSFMGGQLDIAAHPDFEKNRRVFLTYVAGNAPPYGIVTKATGLVGTLRLVIASARFEGGRLQDLKTIAEADQIPDNHHFGGRMAFHPSGDLLVSVGDAYDTPDAALDPSSRLGKILRVTANGQVSVYASGLRNTQGMAVSATNGRMYAVDHGPIGGDELNVIVEGGNYGWPIVTAGEHEFDYTPSQPVDPAMIAPIHVWAPPFAPSGIALYEGDMFPEWRGQLLAAALAGQRIDRLVFKDGGVSVAGTLLDGQTKRIRDIAIANDGAILAITDEKDGCLLRIWKQA